VPKIISFFLARIINTSTSTLAVRKKTGVFSFSESERLFRIRRIYNRAMEIFEDRELTKKWLKEPNWQLGGTAPIDFIDTEIGAREVENLLGRLEHGIFS
jgi:putative toxin-antitoxin system antitoxin component (TIGR02293 family)